MKQLFTLAMALCICMGSFAQTDTTGKPQNSDTIKVGNIIIIKNNDGKTTSEEKPDKQSGDDGISVEIKKRKTYKPSNISTNWWITDLGFTNVNDQTNYAAIAGPGGYFPGGTKSLMGLRTGKSVNVNFWFFMQRINMIEHVVNLKYGLGLELNNYRYENNIRHRFEPTDFISRDSISLDKNKLAADYITLPVMLNFNFTPKKKKSYGFSAGVSVGYLYSSRQKMKSDLRGKEKVKNDFNLEPWKVSAIGELNLGIVRLYGSYALNNMFRSGLDQTPYNVGLRFSSW